MLDSTFTTVVGGYKYTINIKKVWDLTAHIKPKPLLLKNFEPCLDWRCWEKEELTPNLLLEHYARVVEADMNFPIIVVRDQWGYVTDVVDGMHRLVKAFYKGYEKIVVVEIPEVFLEIHYDEKQTISCDVCGRIPCGCH